MQTITLVQKVRIIPVFESAGREWHERLEKSHLGPQLTLTQKSFQRNEVEAIHIAMLRQFF